MKLLVKTLGGVESLLANELQKLGATDTEEKKRAVVCFADKETLYKICYCSRLAQRVMIVVSETPTTTDADIYNATRNVAWEEVLHTGSSFYVDHVSFSQTIADSTVAQRRVTDAVLDRVADKTQEQIYVNADDPDAIVNIHVTDEMTTVSIDAVGVPLDCRGYRDDSLKGYTNEVLAAALVEMSGWEPTQSLVDPMCGAGTICIEAAMKARNIPAAAFRKYAFLFENLKDFDQELWNKVRQEANAQQNNIRLSITGSDVDTEATDIAKTTTLELKMTNDVRISRKSIREQARMTQEGIIITCPPVHDEETRRGATDFYKEATFYMSRNFPDYDVWIFSPNADAMDAIPFDAQEEKELADGIFNCYPF